MAGKAARPLPPLSGLDCSKLTPEAKRQKAPDDAADADDADDAPVTGWTVTQAQAKQWFEDAGPGGLLGLGAYGETRKHQLPGGRWVVVKRFTDANPCKGRKEAKIEVKRHLAVWTNSAQECRQYMSEPAIMRFEREVDRGTYTVQSLIQDPGMVLMRTSHLRDVDLLPARRILPQLLLENKVEICKAYGAMRACIAQAGVLHQDLHTGNVVCLTTYPVNDADLPAYLDNGVLKEEMKPDIVIAWRVVDWGVAETFNPKTPEQDDAEICWVPRNPDNTTGPTDDAKFGVRDKAGECKAEKQDWIPRTLFRMFFFERWGPTGQDKNCRNATTESECVTPSDVYRWVREGFAEALGKTVPADLEKATEDRAQAVRRLRGFRGGSGVGV